MLGAGAVASFTLLLLDATEEEEADEAGGEGEEAEAGGEEAGGRAVEVEAGGEEARVSEAAMGSMNTDSGREKSVSSVEMDLPIMALCMQNIAQRGARAQPGRAPMPDVTFFAALSPAHLIGTP